MDAIETLMREHRTIERVITALSAFAAETQQGGATDREELARFVAFIRRYADQLHHGKEEDILFRAMGEHGFPTEGGPVAVMLAEHDRGRAFIQVLAEPVEGTEPWTDDERRLIANAAAGYAALLRAHIHKEDAILYPMAEQHLPQEALDDVSEACAAFDDSPRNAALHEEMTAIALELVARHAPALAAQENHP
jgi:hemerythrin-like domain-containing protein